MRILTKCGLVAASALLLSTLAGESKAGIILGNIPPTYQSPTYNTNGQVPITSGNNYGVEFTASSAETVTSATLILTIGAGVVPTLGIYTSATPSAGSLVGAFTDSSLSTGTAQTETFTGSASLASGQTYYLILGDTGAPVEWLATFTGTAPNGLTPIGPGGTYVAAGTGTGYAAGNTKPSFELDSGGSAVPEPSSLILAGVGGLIVLGGRSLRCRKAGSVA